MTTNRTPEIVEDFKVLRQEVLRALDNLNDILQQLDIIEKIAVDTYNVGYDTGNEDGYHEGYDEGYYEGYEAGSKEC